MMTTEEAKNKMMTTTEAKELVMKVFEAINKSETIEDIEAIAEKLIPRKIKFDLISYPKIEFSITHQEINDLIKSGILTEAEDYSLSPITNSFDTLTKLLYSLVWKMGNLKKLRHIIQGIRDNDKIDDKEDALVLYNFGGYLTKTEGHPIIDQHVIRAFAVYKAKDTDQKEIKTWLELQTINSKHKDIIGQYRVWLDSIELKKELKSNIEYSLDKLLFVTGKTIKRKKDKRKSMS